MLLYGRVCTFLVVVTLSYITSLMAQDTIAELIQQRTELSMVSDRSVYLSTCISVGRLPLYLNIELEFDYRISVCVNRGDPQGHRVC